MGRDIATKEGYVGPAIPFIRRCDLPGLVTKTRDDELNSGIGSLRCSMNRGNDTYMVRIRTVLPCRTESRSMRGYSYCNDAISGVTPLLNGEVQ
jgi:hypothetical protein